jgi:poly(3-hydroxyalkanoate) synthetase
LKQGFLAAQDWWDVATDGMPGLGKRNADRVRFQMRQVLDLVSPSNYPWLNPEIIAEARKTNGRNLIEGATHFTEDLMQTMTQVHPRRHFRIGHRNTGALYMGTDAWLAQHDLKAGSWLPNLSSWLAQRSGPRGDVPQMGAPDIGLAPPGPAPGSYVHQV